MEQEKTNTVIPYANDKLTKLAPAGETEEEKAIRLAKEKADKDAEDKKIAEAEARIAEAEAAAKTAEEAHTAQVDPQTISDSNENQKLLPSIDDLFPIIKKTARII